MKGILFHLKLVNKNNLYFTRRIHNPCQSHCDLINISWNPYDPYYSFNRMQKRTGINNNSLPFLDLSCSRDLQAWVRLIRLKKQYPLPMLGFPIKEEHNDLKENMTAATTMAIATPCILSHYEVRNFLHHHRQGGMRHGNWKGNFKTRQNYYPASQVLKQLSFFWMRPMHCCHPQSSRPCWQLFLTKWMALLMIRRTKMVVMIVRTMAGNECY
mmetsp:Transcript_27755/g.58637  ORF Transcript_27755/g.58637 Transcript_27755/m.58637 type:complete len:213 (-) Transcript_27755:1671-2309(-)